MTATERHAALVEHGWRVDTTGKWRSPDPADRGHYTITEAWQALTSAPDPKDVA